MEPVATFERLIFLEKNDFDALWLKINTKATSRFLCTIYRSPNDKRYDAFFEYLGNCVNEILLRFPNSEVSFLGNFNVHNKDWLRFSRSNTPKGNAAHLFLTSCALIQIIDCPTRILDNTNDTPHLLDLFLSTAPSYYSFSISSPLGNSDHNLIKIKSPIDLVKPPLPRSNPR